MTTIQIPEGKTSMTLGNGMTIPIPQGATTIDIPDELFQSKKIPSLEIPKEELNQNPFIQQGEEGYNNQVHAMDMEAVNEASKPKSFLDTVKDFGTNVLKNFTQPVKEVALPIASATEELTNTFLPPSLQTDIIPDLPSKTKENPNKKYVDSDTLQSIENLSRTDLRLFGEATQEQKEKYVNDLAKVVNLGGYNLVQLEDGQYKAQNEKSEILDLDAGFYDSMLRGIKADQYEIGGDIAGATLASTIPGGPAKKIIATVGGAALGGMIGNQIDNIVNSLETGQVLSLTDNLNEIGKAGALSLVGNMGGQIAGKTIESAIDGAKYIKENGLPVGKENRANAYINELDNLPQSGTQIPKEEISKSAQEFGGNQNQRLTEQATFNETKNTLSSMYDNNKEAQATLFADEEALTTNLFNKLNIQEKANDRIGSINEKVAGDLVGEVQGIEKYWKDLYDTTRNDIVQIVGNENITVKPKVVDEINKSIRSLEVIQNVQGKNVSQEKLNEFQKDYASMLDAIQINLKQDVEQIVDDVPTIVKEDVNSYTLTGMMDLQKKFNDFFYKHEDKLTGQQKKNLGELKTTIYDDIEEYISNKFVDDPATAKTIKDKWAEINGDYGSWIKTKSKSKILDGLVKGDIEAVDISKGLISDSGDIDTNGLKILGDVAFQLGKTNPEKLEGLYGSIVNGMLNDTMIRKTVNNADVRVIDFEKFNKAYDKMPKNVLNQVFGQTSRGREILDIMDKFKQISKHEAELQKSILKNGSILSEADRTQKEKMRDFLFGIGYAIRHRVVGVASQHLSKSEAYHQVVLDMAKQRRYGIKEFDDSIKRIESNQTKSFSKEEIANLKTIREDVYSNHQQLLKDNETEYQNILKEKNQKLKEEQLLNFKKEQEEKIKANMLLPYYDNYATIPNNSSINVMKDGEKNPVPLDIQDRISVVNTKQPSSKAIDLKAENAPVNNIENNPIFNQEDLKLIAPKDGKYNFNDLVEFEGIVKTLNNSPADILQMDKLTNIKGIRNAITRYSEGKQSQRDIEILDSIQRFMDNEGERFRTKVNEPNNKVDPRPIADNGRRIEMLQNLIQNTKDEKLKEHAKKLVKNNLEDLKAKESNSISNDMSYEEADKAGNIPFSNPVVGGASVGAASGTQTDFNQDGKVDEVDVMIGTLIGSIGIKKTMDLFPQYFKK